MRLTVTDILREIRSGNTYASGIAKKHGVSRQTIQKRLRLLETNGFIKEDVKEGKGKVAVFYKLTPKGFKESRKRKKRISKRIPKITPSHGSIKTPEWLTSIFIHSLRIKLPLIIDNSKNFWQESSDLKYAKKYYHKTEDLTIEKTPSNIILHIQILIDATDSKLFDERFDLNLYNKVLESVLYLNKNNIQVDIDKEKDIMIEYAIDDPLTKQLREIGFRIGEFIDLKRLREKIFKEGLDQKAWAKYDSTPQKFTRETNDRRYVRKVLDMPETLEKMGKEFTPAIKKLTEQIELHLDVQRETGLTLRSIRDELRPKPIKEKIIFKTVNGEQVIERETIKSKKEE